MIIPMHNSTSVVIRLNSESASRNRQITTAMECSGVFLASESLFLVCLFFAHVVKCWISPQGLRRIIGDHNRLATADPSLHVPQTYIACVKTPLVLSHPRADMQLTCMYDLRLRMRSPSKKWTDHASNSTLQGSRIEVESLASKLHGTKVPALGY